MEKITFNIPVHSWINQIFNGVIYILYVSNCGGGGLTHISWSSL